MSAMNLNGPATTIFFRGENWTLSPKHTALIKYAAGHTAINGVPYCNCNFDHIASRDPGSGHSLTIFREDSGLFHDLGDELASNGCPEYVVPAVTPRVLGEFAAFKDAQFAAAQTNDIDDFVPDSFLAK